MLRKKVAIIGSAGIPASYGGFETLAENLTRMLGETVDFTVYCSSKKYKKKQAQHNHAKLVYMPFGSNGKQSIFYDFFSMLHALFYADVMLILGVSGCVFLPLVRFLFRGKIIVNIDGLEWKRDKWTIFAKGYLRFSEMMAVVFSNTVIADHPIIQDYVKRTYKREAELVAYGADHAIKRPLSTELLKEYPFLKEPYALAVCRIEPENNVHMIMDALTRADVMAFVIIGNWDSNQFARDLKGQCLRYHRVYMLDPIYEQEKLDQIRSNCAVYIHGHGAGGTNPSLIEAMALGRPIYAYRADYNESVTDFSAKYYSSAADLYQLMRSLNSSELDGFSERMRRIASLKYRWSVVADKYSDLLDFKLNDADKSR